MGRAACERCLRLAFTHQPSLKRSSWGVQLGDRMGCRVEKTEEITAKLENRRGVRKIKPESVTGPSGMKLSTVVYGYTIIIMITLLFS